MKKLLCMALLCTAVGCAGTKEAPLNYSAEAPSLPAIAAQDGEKEAPGIQGWIPAIFSNLWDVLSINIGTGYGAGAHVQLTNLARVGIGEYADFGLIGVESDVFYGEWHNPLYLEGEDGEHIYSQDVWDIGARFGIGFGGYFMIHTAEIVDWVSTVIGFGYWSLNEDW